jgi:hypothetical protein
MCEFVCAVALCGRTLETWRRLAVLISQPATRAAARAFVNLRALAAGATWRCRTASAPWAAREGHTTVIDAAGAIYVIGGEGSDGKPLQDVWKSTDGGARPDSRVGVGRGYSRGNYRGGRPRGGR